MAKWGLVNIATITEEKVEGEEVGEDGTVETITSVSEGAAAGDSESPSSSADQESGEKRPSLERPSSLVEKDVEEEVEETPRSTSSILSSINFDSDHPAAPARTTLPRTHPAAPRSASPRRRGSFRTGSRASGFTMNLSEKFVTELSFYDPWGDGAPLQSPVIQLGVFLATDQLLGDHSVYKVSPVSPLAALKIGPQDRLLKLNGVSLVGWSHSCVIDYVKSLVFSSCTSTTTQMTADTPMDLTLSMELRRASRSVRSPQEAPPSRILDATLRISRKRATVTAVQERDVCVRYRTTLPRLLKTANKGHQLTTYLSPFGVASLEVRAGEHEASRFLFHTFDVSSTTSTPSSSPHNGWRGGGSCGGGSGGGGGGVEVVVVESDHPRSWFLHVASPSSVSLMFAESVEVQTLTQQDVRFFCLLPVPGDHLYRLQNLATGCFLSVSLDSVGLVTVQDNGSLPSSTILHILPC